jgi:succinyl-CoA synthetase beta subunit
MARKLVTRNVSKDTNGNFGNFDGVEMRGRIGVLGNGAGSVMATLDLVVSSGGKPGVCLNLRHAFLSDTAPTTFNTRLEKALQILAADQSIQVILINFLGSIPQTAEFAEVITKFIQEQPNKFNSQEFNSNGNKNSGGSFSSPPNLVIRLAGSDLDTAKKYLSDLKTEGKSPILLVESLDEAVTQAVKLTKTSAKK